MIPLLALLAVLPVGEDKGAAALDRFVGPGPYPVGVRTMVLVDSSRQDPHAGGPRTLVTEVWYPAVDEARGGKPTTFVEFFGSHPEAAEAFVRHFKGKLDEVNQRFRSIGVRDSRLRPGKFPLLVFSHGNGGLRHQNVTQCDHLASHGYIVASPDHTGNAGVTVLPDKVVPYDRGGRSRAMEDRPKDVKFLIDSLLAVATQKDSWLVDAIDPIRIGCFGHSFGGLTCCQAATIDRRIKAVIPMTLALTKPPDGIPLFLMLGALDRTVDEAGNVASTSVYMSSQGPKHFLALKRGGHFSFSDMDRVNPRFGDGIGTETKDGKTIEFLDSALTKEIINTYSTAFFDAYLRNDAAALVLLRGNRYSEEVDLRNGDDSVQGAVPPATQKL